jgi:hypothetical protein
MNVPGDPNDVDRLGWWDRLPETPVDVDFRQHRIELNALLRAAFLAGAEERSLAAHGRTLTADELRDVMRDYPGDLPTEP